MSTPLYQSEISHDPFLLMFDIFRIEEFHERFPGDKHKVMDVLLWMPEFPNVEAKELVAVMQYRTTKPKHSAAVPGFRRSDDAVFCKFGTEQICKVLQSSMGASALDSKCDSIRELAIFVFCYWILAVTLVNRNRLFQLILEPIRRKSETSFANLITRPIFEGIILFHCLSVCNDH